MATNMNNLTLAQQAVVNQIISTGRQLGVSDTLIEIAVNVANAESTFNYGPQQNTTTANGLFQYTNQSWKEAWARFVAANPNNPLSTWSADKARFDLNAQILVGKMGTEPDCAVLLRACPKVNGGKRCPAEHE